MTAIAHCHCHWDWLARVILIIEKFIFTHRFSQIYVIWCAHASDRLKCVRVWVWDVSVRVRRWWLLLFSKIPSHCASSPIRHRYTCGVITRCNSLNYCHFNLLYDSMWIWRQSMWARRGNYLSHLRWWLDGRRWPDRRVAGWHIAPHNGDGSVIAHFSRIISHNRVWMKWNRRAMTN